MSSSLQRAAVLLSLGAFGFRGAADCAGVMDESDYLRALQTDPENWDARRQYFQWLASNQPSRSDLVRLMAEREEAERRLAALEAAIEGHPARADQQWLDTVFPVLVRAPCIGRFSSRPRPDAPPFVSVGSPVIPATVVCLIEAWSLFNEVVAGSEGAIAKCFVEDGAEVTWQQVLFKLTRPPRQEPTTWFDWC